MADSKLSKESKTTDITNKSAALGRLEELTINEKKKKSEALTDQGEGI
jgi:hypothetical protein